MHTFTDNFPQDHLGHALIALALQANDFSRLPSTMSLEERDKVNALIEPLLDDPFNKNTARMPEEAVSSYLQAAGSAVFTIGHVLLRGESAPLVPATLARTVLENAAVVVFLCGVKDNLRRTARAVNLFRFSLAGVGAGDPEHPYHPIFESINDLKERLGSITSNKADRVPSNYNKLVEANLSDIDGGTVYKLLNQYVHHNFISHASTIISEDLGTPQNAVNIYDFASRAGMALYCAVESAKPFTQSVPLELSVAMKHMLNCYGNFVTYCKKHFSS